MFDTDLAKVPTTNFDIDDGFIHDTKNSLYFNFF